MNGLILLALIGLMIAVAITVFWIEQLVDLMGRRDEEFPGRFDKLIWVAIIVFIPLVGAIAYSISRKPRVFTDRASSKLEQEWLAIEAARRKSNPTPDQP